MYSCEEIIEKATEEEYPSDVLKRENCLKSSSLFFIMFHS